MKIPETFRPPARAKAESFLRGIKDEKQAKRILNQISEEEWALDRLEWRQWMDGMRKKSHTMHATPQDRVNYENRHRR